MTLPLPELKQPAALPAELRACTAFLLARVGYAIKLSAIEAFERQVALAPFTKRRGQDRKGGGGKQCGA